jgi:Flp pilus assembly protein TadG
VIRFATPGALLRDKRGTMAIETALVAPFLLTLSLGAFEVSMLVSREQQLQSSANEASEIVLAAAGGSGINSADLEDILESSLGLEDSQLALAAGYRCGTSTTVETTKPTCAVGEPMYSYVKLTVTDTYEPAWKKFGFGDDVNFNIVRWAQIS